MRRAFLQLLTLLVAASAWGQDNWASTGPAYIPETIASLSVYKASDIADVDRWYVRAPAFRSRATTLDCIAHDGTSIQINVYADYGLTNQIGTTLTCVADPGATQQTGLSVDLSGLDWITFDVVDGSNTGNVQSIEVTVSGKRL